MSPQCQGVLCCWPVLENRNVTNCRRRNLRAELLALAFACFAVGPLSVLWCHQAEGQDVKATPPITQLRAKAALIRLGTTYSRAQVATWLDARRFIVGRWDGTITVFRTMSSESEFGPVLVDALTTPSKQGIEMLANLGGGQFVSSNDAQSLVWWRQVDNDFLPLTLPFAPKYGTAVSAVRVDQNDQDLLFVGHQHGYLTIWSLSDGNERRARPAERSTLRLMRAISLRSGDPVQWQGQSWHIRGLAVCGHRRVISVAEDGDICLLEVPSGKILSRRRYNASAQRGLNDVAVLGDLIAVVNCAVGDADNNLWIYRIAGNSLDLVAGKRLILDNTRDQVFTFSFELFEFGGQPHFVASTEEGVIWLGTVKGNKIVTHNQAKVALEGGVVLALAPSNKTVLSVGHKIQTFTIGSRPVREGEIK
ncbi:MAG: hypothetical protein CMJ50_02560 [Planctomycetaceae bacterium]|nr:hypothetical protein [Planctomycetaceae bacterium]